MRVPGRRPTRTRRSLPWRDRTFGATLTVAYADSEARRVGGRNAVTLLEVTDLTVSFPTADGTVQAVRGVSFSVDSGRTLGIVGESGSGKTVLTQTLLGLTPGGQVEGKAVFDGTDLLGLRPDQLRRVRGAQIAVIFQDPLTS